MFRFLFGSSVLALGQLVALLPGHQYHPFPSQTEVWCTTRARAVCGAVWRKGRWMSIPHKFVCPTRRWGLFPGRGYGCTPWVNVKTSDGGLGSDQDFFPEKWSHIIGLTPPHEVKRETCCKKTWVWTSKKNNGFDCESLVWGTSVSSLGKVIELQNCESSGHDRSTVGSSKHSLELRWCLVANGISMYFLHILM